jgi:hypothetical protein
MIFSAASFSKNTDADVEAQLTQKNIWMNSYFKSDSTVAVMSFRVWFSQNPQKVFETLTDTNSFKHKMNNYSDARALTSILHKRIIDAQPKSAADVVKLIGANSVDSYHNRQVGQNWTDYMFLSFNFPWPLKDRWVVQRARVDETNAGKGEYKFAYEMTVGSFKSLKGQWNLKPVLGKPGWTEFYGEYVSDAGVPLPKFVTIKAMKTSFEKDVDSYRKILEN